MTSRFRSRTGRIVTWMVALAMTTGGAVALPGCAMFDDRSPAIVKAVMEALDDQTYLVGATTGDVRTALKEAGDDPRIMVPIRLPDLGSQVGVAAPSDLQTPYTSVDQASRVLAAVGKQAWQDWLATHTKEVTYDTVQVLVYLEEEDGRPIAVISKSALWEAIWQHAASNARLFVETVEALPEWQMPIVRENLEDFAGTITGLDKAFGELVELESIEPVGDRSFKVSVTYPDPKVIVDAQVEKALESYGTGKLFDVTRDDFERKARKIDDVSLAGAARVATTAVVKLTRHEPEDGETAYDPGVSLVKNLLRQADFYSVAPEAGSYTQPVGLDEVWKAAIDKAWEQLSKQVVKKQARPSTKILTGGKSGMPVAIDVGKSKDRHVTFFKWGTKTQVASGFIRAGGKLSMRLPVGSYRLVYASGDDWYGKKYSYGPYGEYAEFKTKGTSNSAMKIQIKSNTSYTISIAMTPGTGNVPSGNTDNPYEH